MAKGKKLGGHSRPEKTSGNQDVIDAAYALKTGGSVPDAEEFEEGGAVKKELKEGGAAKKKKGGAIERKEGGKVVAPKSALKEGGKIEGRKSGGRADKYQRGGQIEAKEAKAYKSGGRTGSDKNPYSSAKLD